MRRSRPGSPISSSSSRIRIKGTTSRTSPAACSGPAPEAEPLASRKPPRLTVRFEQTDRDAVCVREGLEFVSQTACVITPLDNTVTFVTVSTAYQLVNISVAPLLTVMDEDWRPGRSGGTARSGIMKCHSLRDARGVPVTRREPCVGARPVPRMGRGHEVRWIVLAWSIVSVIGLSPPCPMGSRCPSMTRTRRARYGEWP